MDREEYAKLHYLLAKLKYICAELVTDQNALSFDEIIDKINDIQKILILPNSN